MTTPPDSTLPRELDVINEITKAVTSTLDLAEIIRAALAHIKTLASAEAISLLRYDPERDELVFAATETLRESTLSSTAARDERGLAAWVARTGRSAIVDDAADRSALRRRARRRCRAAKAASCWRCRCGAAVASPP